LAIATELPSPGGRGWGRGKIWMRKTLTRFAKTLRKESTRAEALLWQGLRAKQLAGIKFRRQEPIGHFIVDFVSFEKRIIIELDGGQHAHSTLKDLERDAILAQRGFTVLRFWNNEVLENLEGVLDSIMEACSE
jgi:very-short-patch-repair endonuclease